ncbi:hypothetical protein ACFFGH_29595 [Lysobacter korlensis]|uniref:Uncharacterized protein n=1 Tax=Lysobacter korlensis TaxID=553636 RepID=A0ABV6RYY6_9GAMM
MPVNVSAEAERVAPSEHRIPLEKSACSGGPYSTRTAAIFTEKIFETCESVPIPKKP